MSKYLFLPAGLLIIILFFTPARNFVNNLIMGDKSRQREGQVIGTVSGYNPRVEEIQRILKDANFGTVSVDGLMGDKTRKVIRDFQKEKGLLANGKVDSKTWLELIRLREELKEKPEVQSLVLPVTSHPRDAKSEDEVRRIIGPRGKTTQAAIPRDKNKQIQLALQKAGYYKGKIDGKIGPQTKEAIKAFQKVKGLKADGVVGYQAWVELRKNLRD